MEKIVLVYAVCFLKRSSTFMLIRQVNVIFHCDRLPRMGVLAGLEPFGVQSRLALVFLIFI